MVVENMCDIEFLVCIFFVLDKLITHMIVGDTERLRYQLKYLTLKRSHIHKYFFTVFFLLFSSENIRLGISCEPSANLKIHMKHQTLFSLKDKSNNNNNNNKVSSAAFFVWRFKSKQSNI